MPQDEPAANLCVEQAHMQGVCLLFEAADKVNFIYEDRLRWTCTMQPEAPCHSVICFTCF